jgi:PAS domain S-box-containing protein
MTGVDDRSDLDDGACLPGGDEIYRRLVEVSPDAITLTDLDMKVLLCNQQAAVVHGAGSVEEMIGKTALDAIAPEDRERAIENAKKTLEFGSVRDVEYMLLRMDGTRFPAELSASVILDAAGKPTAFISVVRDISERKRAEDALRASEERFRTLYQDNPTMYFTVGTDGIVLSVNEFGAEQLGYSVEELVGRPVLDVFYEDDKRAVSEQMKACLRSNGKVAHWEFRKVRKDGAIIWVKEAVRTTRGGWQGR